MKKSLFTMAMAAIALTANATDYQGNYSNNAGGQTSTVEGKVSIEEGADGTSTVTIHNYAYEVYGSKHYVGNIVLNGVKTSKVGNVTIFESAQNVDITEGDVDTYTWEGPGYSALCNGGVPVIFKAELRGDKLTAAFNLDTFQAIKRRIKATFGENRYTIGQILGSNFDAWHTAKYTGGVPKKDYTSDEPDGWHSFMSASGTLTGFVSKNTHTYKSDDVRPGGKGTSLKLVSGIVNVGIKQPANGTITTGRLQASGFTPKDTGNNSTSDPSSSDVDGNNDPFFSAISSRPDSIAVWVKYKQGTLSESDKKNYPYATISAIINDGTKIQDPADKEYKTIVATAQNKEIAETGNEWKRISVPFNYTSYDIDPKAILVTISTNAEPGVASSDENNPDVLYIDDLELIYNAQLSDMSIRDIDFDFDPNKYYYEGLIFNGELTESDLEPHRMGNGSYINSTITRSPAEKGYATVTVTVTSADLKTVNAYTFKVKEAAAEPTKDYTGNLTISLNGEPQDPAEATISTVQHEDGTYDIRLNQFSFGPFLIGDVTIKNVPATEVDGWTVYTTEQDAEITNGAEIAEALGGKVHVKLAAQSKDDDLYAEITLPVELGEDVIDVFAVFGNKPATGINGIEDNANTTVTGIYNASGMKLQKLQRGINIVRTADGKTVKIMK